MQKLSNEEKRLREQLEKLERQKDSLADRKARKREIQEEREQKYRNYEEMKEIRLSLFPECIKKYGFSRQALLRCVTDSQSKVGSALQYEHNLMILENMGFPHKVWELHKLPRRTRIYAQLVQLVKASSEEILKFQLLLREVKENGKKEL